MLPELYHPSAMFPLLQQAAPWAKEQSYLHLAKLIAPSGRGSQCTANPAQGRLQLLHTGSKVQDMCMAFAKFVSSFTCCIRDWNHEILSLDLQKLRNMSENPLLHQLPNRQDAVIFQGSLLVYRSVAWMSITINCSTKNKAKLIPGTPSQYLHFPAQDRLPDCRTFPRNGVESPGQEGCRQGLCGC